jgi:hypothetical protein
MRLSKKAAEAEKEADLAQSDLDRAASRIISASSPFSGSCAVIWDPLICVKNPSPFGEPPQLCRDSGSVSCSGLGVFPNGRRS